MLPSAVVEPFVDILNSIHHIGLWPPQLLLNLFSLIPKSLGGSRAIAKTPIFYRLWCLMRSEVIRDWSRETCPDWEYAAAGRNCLSAAATHQWVNELAHASGNVSAALLWDIWKYFDSINYEDVTRVASKLQYPTSDLKLALQMHAAPRILQMSGISSMAMKPFRSILQGCFHSGFIARMITHFPVERIYKEQRDEGFRRPATTHTFVDDVSQFNLGTARTVLRTLVHAGVSLVGSFRVLKLAVSPKSVVLSTSTTLAKSISNMIYTYTGHRLPIKRSARDLGVLNSIAPTRRTAVITSRFNKAKARMNRIAPLSRKVRGARILTSTGAIPSALWGHQAIGVAPRQLQELRSAAATAAAIGGAGRCTTTAIALSLGPDKDPALVIADQQVRFFFSLLSSDSTLRGLTARHWSDLSKPLLSEEGQVVWNKAYGPVTATMATLLQYKWRLPSISRWIDPTGQEWIADLSMEPALMAPFLKSVKDSVYSTIWTNAAEFEHGRGLDQGVDWCGTLSLRNQLQKTNGDQPTDGIPDELLLSDELTWPERPLVWLELFLSGGFWSNERFARSDPQRSTRCERCGAPVEDMMHVLWECEANKEIPSPHILHSQPLLSQARAGVDTFPCLWLRGLLPASVIPNNTPMIDHDEISYIGSPPPTDSWPSGVYYADASGGKFSSLPVLRRCGVGVCRLSDDLNIDILMQQQQQLQQPQLQHISWGLFAPLPGDTQTVTRAELYAILLVARHACMSATIEVATDSKVNADLFLVGRSQCLNTSNADLWNELFGIVQRNNIALNVRWVKGHVTSVEIAQHYSASWQDILGNHTADILAGRAAEFYECVPQDVSDVLWYYSIVRKVQSRAIAVLSAIVPHRPTATKRERVPRPLSTPLGVAVMASQHKFTFFSGSARCYICHESAPSMRSHLMDWLCSPCKVDPMMAHAFFSGTKRPAKVPNHRPVVVGKQVVHDSHKIHVYQGLIFCGACGYYASKRLLNLVNECQPLKDHDTIMRVKSLRQGKLPSGLIDWPNSTRRQEFSLL